MVLSKEGETPPFFSAHGPVDWRLGVSPYAGSGLGVAPPGAFTDYGLEKGVGPL